MILVALTGGIGSGKSSVAKRLVDRGAVLIDADATVRELQQPGEPVFAWMVERWGDPIVDRDGTLNRQAVADIVFNDTDELKALEAVIHPEVRNRMAERITALASTDSVVVQDLPLMVEWGGGRRGTSGVIVVDTPVELAIARLVEHRGFTRADAEARMKNQATREQRLKLADFVVDNSGSLGDLDDQVDRCWQWIVGLAPTPWPPPVDDAQPTGGAPG